MAVEVLVVLPLLTAAAMFVVAVNAWYWPRDSDGNVAAWLHRAGREFYGHGYAQADELRYQEVAEAAAQENDVIGSVTNFVLGFGLQDARVLDVGAGRGYLQDIVRDYTGFDLSPTAGRFFHKPFVEGSASALPFSDSQFDAAWSVWALEHVLEPEKALSEIRRVLKPGGYAFLMPAWNVDPWAPHGYRVRPYTDLDWKGKLIKATLFVQDSWLLKATYLPIRRLIRLLVGALSSRPLALRFSRMTPNYSRYWTTDSDAAIHVDWHEAALWFASRGDECLSCSLIRDVARPLSRSPLVIRIRK
jgi:SAM-dependent methyltransferase